MTNLHRLGSAEEQTRADTFGEKTELNPVYHYEDEGVHVRRLGGAAVETRADSPEGQLELIPVQRWEMGGLRAA